MQTGSNDTSPDSRIQRFISRHRVLTLATTSGGELWCCNLFYAILPPGTQGFTGGALVFTSPETTRHAAMFTDNPDVAGSIVLESKVVARLQGLQLQGTVHPVGATAGILAAAAKSAYLKRYPFAALMLSDLWVLEITRLKYTDNTLGFGTKLHWPAQ